MNDELEKLVEEAQPDVSERKLARIYAEALLNAAEKNDAGPEVLGELHQFLDDIRRRDPYVRAFFTSGVIGKERREAALKAAFGGRAHPVLMNFLLVLNDHDRLMLIRPILDEMQNLEDLRRRRFRVQVRSAVPLSAEQSGRLLNDLRGTFRLEPIIDQQIEPQLLGGMILRVGDFVFDGSVRTQILNLRKQLREMSSHEIQSRRDCFSPAT